LERQPSGCRSTVSVAVSIRKTVIPFPYVMSVLRSLLVQEAPMATSTIFGPLDIEHEGVVSITEHLAESGPIVQRSARDLGQPELLTISEDSVHAWIADDSRRLSRLLAALRRASGTCDVICDAVVEDERLFEAVIDTAAADPERRQRLIALAVTHLEKLVVTTQTVIRPTTVSPNGDTPREQHSSATLALATNGQHS
jgi:hypothetical protein